MARTRTSDEPPAILLILCGTVLGVLLVAAFVAGRWALQQGTELDRNTTSTICQFRQC